MEENCVWIEILPCFIFLHFKLSKQQKNGKIRTTSAIDEWHGLYEHFSKHAILLIFLLSSQDLGRIFKFRIGKMSYFVVWQNDEFLIFKKRRTVWFKQFFVEKSSYFDLVSKNIKTLISCRKTQKFWFSDKKYRNFRYAYSISIKDLFGNLIEQLGLMMEIANIDHAHKPMRWKFKTFAVTAPRKKQHIAYFNAYNHFPFRMKCVCTDDYQIKMLPRRNKNINLSIKLKT